MHKEPPVSSAADTGNDANAEDAIYGAIRGLIRDLPCYTGDAAYDELLLPWLDTHAAHFAWLTAFATRAGTLIPPATVEDRWLLYALSRLCELLRLAAFPTTAGARERPAMSAAQFHAFFFRLGIDVHSPAGYTPFHCEPVRVVPAGDARQAPVVLATVWPCLMLGNMLVMRAGIIVEAGEQVLRAGIADAATLYWTYARESRPAEDLSHGWGSNSAWRTEFRRDYHIGDSFYFNADGTVDLAALDPGTVGEDGLSRDERIELLVHRSFVTTTRAHADLFPYYDRVTLPVTDLAPMPVSRRWWKKFR